MTKCVVPISGGKDSQACLLLAINRFGTDSVIPVFNDVGWDHPITYKHIEYLSNTLNIEIFTTKGYKDWPDLPSLIRTIGRFPFGRGRFCTMYLKQYALRDFYADNIYDGKTKHEFWYGMRTTESTQRAIKYKGITADDLFDMNDLFPGIYNAKLRSTISVRLPVIEWTTGQVFEYLDTNKVDRNPLYFEGTNDRVGCYPCLLANKKVQELMFSTEIGKQRLDVIKQLEIDIGKRYEMVDTGYGTCSVCNM